MDDNSLENIKAQIQSFKDALKINEHDLQRECANQPVLLADIGVLKSAVGNLLDSAKNRVKLIDAEIAADARKNPDKYELSKTTDSCISSAVIMNKEHKLATVEYIEINELYNVVSSLYEAIAGRRSGIRELVSLFVNNYYSEIDAPTQSTLMDSKRERIAKLRSEKEI